MEDTTVILFLNGKEVGSLFIQGKEISELLVNETIIYSKYGII